MPDIVATKPADAAPVETAWGQQVHDMLEGIQAGTVTIVTTAASTFDYLVTFPRAYTVAPFVVCSPVGGSVNMVQPVNLPTTTGVNLRAFKRDGSAFTAGTSITVHWFAIGNPA